VCYTAHIVNLKVTYTSSLNSKSIYNIHAKYQDHRLVEPKEIPVNSTSPPATVKFNDTLTSTGLWSFCYSVVKFSDTLTSTGLLSSCYSVVKVIIILTSVNNGAHGYHTLVV
jgi:hypothetical protein